MKTIFASTLAFVALNAAHALPNGPVDGLSDRDAAQTVTLIFEGGPASYNLSIPADGQEYFTYNDLSISLIISPDYNPYRYCTFKTSGSVALAPSLVTRPEDLYPINELAVGPPQPIISVICIGVCLGVYGDCENWSPNLGTTLTDCCNGFCAATKCRPWLSS